MKHFILLLLLLSTVVARTQKIDSIYVNLYTDSLKKGTFNYINIDGLLPNGRYLPLDSTDLIFSASAGKFFGNSLWVDNNFSFEKINIKVTLRQNPAVYKQFYIYIKKKNDDEKLKTAEEILSGMKNDKKQRKKRS